MLQACLFRQAIPFLGEPWDPSQRIPTVRKTQLLFNLYLTRSGANR